MAVRKVEKPEKTHVDIPFKKEQPLTIKKFTKHEIEFSNGAVITCETGEFDYDVIHAILKAGE